MIRSYRLITIDLELDVMAAAVVIKIETVSAATTGKVGRTLVVINGHVCWGNCAANRDVS